MSIVFANNSQYRQPELFVTTFSLTRDNSGETEKKPMPQNLYANIEIHRIAKDPANAKVMKVKVPP